MTETKAPKTRKPLIDYTALTATEVDAKTVRPATVESTPFREWYKESQTTGKGKSFIVPASAATQTENLLRRAAELTGPECGIQIGKRELGNNQVQITFIAKAKRKTDPSKPRKPRAIKRKEGESASDWRARQERYNTALRAWERANGGAK